MEAEHVSFHSAEGVSAVPSLPRGEAINQIL